MWQFYELLQVGEILKVHHASLASAAETKAARFAAVGSGGSSSNLAGGATAASPRAAGGATPSLERSHSAGRSGTPLPPAPPPVDMSEVLDCMLQASQTRRRTHAC